MHVQAETVRDHHEVAQEVIPTDCHPEQREGSVQLQPRTKLQGFFAALRMTTENLN